MASYINYDLVVSHTTNVSEQLNEQRLAKLKKELESLFYHTNGIKFGYDGGNEDDLNRMIAKLLEEIRRVSGFLNELMCLGSFL
jgi:hypothetical protein